MQLGQALSPGDFACPSRASKYPLYVLIRTTQ